MANLIAGLDPALTYLSRPEIFSALFAASLLGSAIVVAVIAVRSAIRRRELLWGDE